ncbi:hypothetical protein CYMTET_39876 [Cymbomonas tetramitiformis]|uniref:Uncharacterized protein n=1 Tax=Cymbomonas tetramitiformis TaxID=36881 RepID=A0AAE0C998_9CHLO|nr:hypothetical protein CYMTET_39876 [Cymbomonas tetramitiformis]
MVFALQTAFVTEDIGFAPLFRLDDATLPIRVEANSLLFSTLELLRLQRRARKAARTRATLLDEDVKAMFIKALDQTFYQPMVSRLLLHDQRAAHEARPLHHSAMGARMLHPAHVKAGTVTTSAHRYSHGRHFMERDERATDDPDSAIADLRTMDLDLKRQWAALTDSDESPPADRGFTPRAAKAGRDT